MKLNVVLAALNLVYLSCILASGLLCDQVASVKEAKLNGVPKHKFEVIPIVGAVGPESFAFHPITGEGPYTGVSDGRIIKWNQQQRGWTNFAVTSSKRCMFLNYYYSLSISQHRTAFTYINHNFII